MLADTILRFLGRTPTAYPRGDDKWAAITADMIDLLVPVVMVVVFLLPLAWLWWRKVKRHKDFTIVSILLAVLIGAGLAYGVWWLNEWSYGYGVGVIYHAIY